MAIFHSYVSHYQRVDGVVPELVAKPLIMMAADLLMKMARAVANTPASDQTISSALSASYTWVWLKIMVPMTHRNDHV